MMDVFVRLVAASIAFTGGTLFGWGAMALYAIATTLSPFWSLPVVALFVLCATMSVILYFGVLFALFGNGNADE